jgi:hypothetical protein
MAAVHKGDEDGSENECLIGTIVSLNDTFYHLKDVFDKKEVYPLHPTTGTLCQPVQRARGGTIAKLACQVVDPRFGRSHLTD